MKMYNIRFDFIHPPEKVPRRYMRKIGLFAMDAREEGMQLVVEGVSYHITMLCFTHLWVRTGHIALDARIKTKMLNIAHNSACAALTINGINL